MSLIYKHVIDLETFSQTEACQRRPQKRSNPCGASPSPPQQQGRFGDLVVKGVREVVLGGGGLECNIPVRSTGVAGRNRKGSGR